MSTTIDTNSRAERFLERLRKIQNDRGKMAALRRGLSEATKREAWPVIAGLGEDIENRAAITVAALFAEHPVEAANARSLGQTCRSIATNNGQSSDIPDSFDKRFRRLIACDTAEEVAGQLSAWVRLAKSRGVGMNYQELFNDLAYWHLDADRKRVRWARDFWAPRRDDAETPTEETARP